MFLILLVASTSHKTLKNIYNNHNREPSGGEGATTSEKGRESARMFRGCRKQASKQTKNNQSNNQNPNLLLRLNCFPTVTISNS